MKHHCRTSQGDRSGIEDEGSDVDSGNEHYCRDEWPEGQDGSRAIDALSSAGSNTQATLMQTITGTACSTGLAPAIIDGGNEVETKYGPWQTGV
jgi:hypothetical protein